MRAERLEQASDCVDELQSTAEVGVDQLRDRVGERYRRDRQQLADQVSGAPERPGPYVADLIGQRPDGASREEWDHAARAITA